MGFLPGFPAGGVIPYFRRVSTAIRITGISECLSCVRSGLGRFASSIFKCCTNSSICCCIASILARMFRMISTPARVHAQIACQMQNHFQTLQILVPSIAACCRRCGWASAVPSRSYRRSVCGWIPYCSATDEIMYAAFDFSRIALHVLRNIGSRAPYADRPSGRRRHLRQLPQNFLGSFIADIRHLQLYLYNLIAPRASARVQYAALTQAGISGCSASLAGFSAAFCRQMVGTSIFAPRPASAMVTGTIMWMLSPSRLNRGCGSTCVVM